MRREADEVAIQGYGFDPLKSRMGKGDTSSPAYAGASPQGEAFGNRAREILLRKRRLLGFVLPRRYMPLYIRAHAVKVFVYGFVGVT